MRQAGEIIISYRWPACRLAVQELYFHGPSCNVAVMSISLTLGIVLTCLLPAGSEREAAKTPAPLPVLTTVGAIRQLAAAEARRGYPVRIRGVITLNNPYTSLMFVQDASGGIYVSPEKLPWPERTGFSQGMLVQIEGRTSFGRFSPTVRGKEDAAGCGWRAYASTRAERTCSSRVP